MNKRSKIIVSIVGITIVLLTLLGITYAYYLTRIEGNTNTNSISVTTADLKLKYGDGNGLLTATNITPGKQVEFKTSNNTTTTEKTFTVTNSGNSVIEGYAVSLDYAYIENTMPSIFERPEDFQITLTCSTNRTGETCNGFTGNFNNESIMMTSNDIDENEVHTYSLSIYYDDPGLDQSNDMGKNLNLKVQLYNLSETTDIEGTITGVEASHSVRIESEPKMSTIVNGKYNFKGIEIGTHTLTVLDESGNEVDKEYIVVKSGTTPGIAETKATIDGEEVDATGITITNNQRVVKLNTKVESNVLSFDTSTSSTSIFNPYSSNKNSLAYQIINNAVVAKENNSTSETIYSAIPFTKPAEEISALTEKNLSFTRDDYGVSYYYRGNVEDNYVNFGGMCWKILRIGGDGSVKLILEDRDENCSLNYDGNWAIPRTSDLTSYIGNYGYTQYINGKLYSSDGKTTNQYVIKVVDYLHGATTFDSSMASAFKTFQNSKIINYVSKLKKGDWCMNDNAYSSYTQSLSSMKPLTDNEMLDKRVAGGAFNLFYFSSYVRLNGQNKDGYSPNLECDGRVINDFDDSNKTPMYVAAITADELVYAGASLSEVNSNFFLINEEFKKGSSGLNKSNNFWTLSSSRWASSLDAAFALSNSGEVTTAAVTTYYALRPVVNLIVGVEVVQGNGTLSNPYVIE